MKTRSILFCSMLLLQITAPLNGNDTTKYASIAKKPACNAEKQKNKPKAATNLATNEAGTKNKIKYYFVNSAVPLNGPMSKY